MKNSIVLCSFFTLLISGMNAQTFLDYQDFHLGSSPGPPYHNTIILNTNYINIDTLNYINYVLTSSSSCYFGSMNSLVYVAMTPTSGTGLQASNMYITYQVPSKTYYISDFSGVYSNGSDWSYYEYCPDPWLYISSRVVYSDPATMLVYPVIVGGTFTDSAYYTILNNWGGCFSPYSMHTEYSSVCRSLIMGKVINTGGLITPCDSYDSVYFIRTTAVTDEQRQVHTVGMDSLYNYIDTTYTEKYTITSVTTLGIARDHPYFLFREDSSETLKYFPDSSISTYSYARFYFRDSIWLGADKTFDEETKVFPNPGSGIFTISSGSPIDKVDVINSLGQQVSVSYPGLTGHSTEINLTSFPAGIYTLRIVHAKLSEYTRVIKQ